MLGDFGNCMILPCSIPAALAVKLAGDPGGVRLLDGVPWGRTCSRRSGGKTIDSAEQARKDALSSATQLAGKALDAGVDVFETKIAADKAVDGKQAAEKTAKQEKEKTDATAEERAKADKQASALKDLKENAAAYLGAANHKPDLDQARAFVEGIVTGLAGGALPPERGGEALRRLRQEKRRATRRTGRSAARRGSPRSA